MLRGVSDVDDDPQEADPDWIAESEAFVEESLARAANAPCR
jgi:hypothetical protein